MCTKCGLRPRVGKQRWCSECHAAYMREWRKGRPMTEEQQRKSLVRGRANVYQRRGWLEPQPCIECGGTAEKHHPDYTQPLYVVWLCREHHRDLHARIAARGTPRELPSRGVSAKVPEHLRPDQPSPAAGRASRSG